MQIRQTRGLGWGGEYLSHNAPGFLSSQKLLKQSETTIVMWRSKGI
jgi:hypothetical protein